ncbi:MAG: dehypoxanthine futalosine cyclase [Actinobacteria bacterium]|nr:MAG: dehypoxanthine futalosine cyclase [Actinomycetota bacterium]
MEILNKVYKSQRITEDEAIALLEQKDLIGLGQAANYVRQKKIPGNLATFVIDRNINYTNICTTKCKFCAFFRPEGDPEGYTLSVEEVIDKISEAKALDGTQIMLQGGLNPQLDLNYYLTILKEIKKKFDIQIHSFSPPEIVYFSKQFGMSFSQTLQTLKEAGLDSIPGGGAEILVDEVRKIIAPSKIPAKLWLEVMEEAHKLGMKSTATMMFGSVESYADRVEHMKKIRGLQDKTGGFTAFIPWTYQSGHTELGGEQTTAIDYLKTLAVSRIYLDNVPNIQASWVTQGAKIGQLALTFGANDLGSMMIEENVVAATGVNYKLSKEEIVRIIKDAGFEAAQRTTMYEVIERY